MKIFVAFSFRDADKELAAYVEQVLASHDVMARKGKVAGEQLNPAIQALIEGSDALIALLTRRDKKDNGSWTTHDWVKDELTYARAKGKPAIALIEKDVDTGGMNAVHEHIELDRGKPHLALLALSETIGQWRRDMGRTVKIQLLPPTVAGKLGNGSMTCRQRLNLHGKYSDWAPVTVSPETGGTFVYVQGIQDDHLIQLQVQDTGKRKIWESVMTSQWMSVELKPRSPR